jgi:predicted Fe-S protein YdhL (DUF1289 family)
MKSPCLKVCLMDPESDLCKGCFRTLDEIARWSRMTDDEREKVFLVLEERKRNEKSNISEIPVPPLS